MEEKTVRRIVKMYRFYRLAGGVIGFLAVAYILLLSFPQVLFAHSTRHGTFTVYARKPLDAGLEAVLEKADEKLRASPLYDGSAERRVYLTDSFGMYALLSHKAYASFANSVPFIDNIIVNRSDLSADRVYIPRSWSNERSLSGVIAHETTHLFIRSRYGTLQASLMPAWKNEGYCEYIAGDSTITLDEGIKRWRENPADDTRYRSAKYNLMVKHLIEDENMSLDDMFTKPLDEKEVAARTFAKLK